MARDYELFIKETIDYHDLRKHLKLLVYLGTDSNLYTIHTRRLKLLNSAFRIFKDSVNQDIAKNKIILLSKIDDFQWMIFSRNVTNKSDSTLDEMHKKIEITDMKLKELYFKNSSPVSNLLRKLI